MDYFDADQMYEDRVCGPCEQADYEVWLIHGEDYEGNEELDEEGE